MELTYLFPLYVAAWFLQMGLHEGGHAYAAYYLGDDTSYLLGKRSINPLNHVEWDNFSSILMSVIVPCLTAAAGLVPMGMASVPVDVRRLKRRERDLALVSFAGPLGNMVLMAFCLLFHKIILAFFPSVQVEGSIVWFFNQLCFCVFQTSTLYAIFNLIPIPPLDGASILRYFLPRSGKNIIDSLRPYGFTILMVLFWVGNAGKFLYFPLDIAERTFCGETCEQYVEVVSDRCIVEGKPEEYCQHYSEASIKGNMLFLISIYSSPIKN